MLKQNLETVANMRQMIAPRSQLQYSTKLLYVSMAYLKRQSLKRRDPDEEYHRDIAKLQVGSQMQSIRDDLNKDMVFSRESAEAIYNMVNVELIELRQTTDTPQCPACWKHFPQGMLQCLCGNWLRPDEHTINQIKFRFAELLRRTTVS